MNKQITFAVSRFDGETSYIQTYQLDYQSGKTVLWWLNAIKEEQDPSLTLTVACRAGLCGACALQVNGDPVLACETLLDPLLMQGQVKIEPLNAFPLVRDLMLDWRGAIARMKSIHPWLEVENDQTSSTGCVQTQMEYQEVKPYVACIGCGICASVCPALAGEGFIEPFLFVKARRLIVDSRSSDRSRQAVLKAVRPYLQNCLHCGICEKACPKSVSPEKAISSMETGV
ncbi:MAG: frdB1 [Anaerosporomusa subterranea]|jgi:succinate dehydrogenase/fumarate reductase iron-sulfur protein|nr:frdB1 [Anaerosporomusa subterranea]